MGLDSAELTMDLEDRFCISFLEADAQIIRTVGDLVNYVIKSIHGVNHELALERLSNIAQPFRGSLEYKELKDVYKWLPNAESHFLWLKFDVDKTELIKKIAHIVDIKGDQKRIRTEILDVIVDRLGLKSVPNDDDDLVKDLGMN